MTGRRLLPDAAELQKLRQSGLTLREIAEHICEDTGEKVTVAAISAALNRAGYGNEKVRYEDLIPWRVQMRHQKAYHVRMLRLEGRRRAGHKLRAEEQRRLDSWIEDLREAGAVIHYNPDYGTEGFYASQTRHDKGPRPLRGPFSLARTRAPIR